MRHSIKTIAIGSMAAIILTGCEAPQGGLGEKAREGAIAGAILGGVVGAIDGGKPKNVIVGATVGAGVGTLLGTALDRQEADLRERISDSGATITNTGSELIVTLPEAITFATDSTDVRGSSRRHLAELSQSLREYPGSSVDVIGHTDNVGDQNYNQNLSARRAQAVYQVMINNGVAPNRMRPFGRGEFAPIASNTSPQGRQQNRRVEVVITPQV